MDVFDRALQTSDLLAATVTDLEIRCARNDRFTNYLRWSSNDLFDAECLRSLFFEYER